MPNPVVLLELSDKYTELKLTEEFKQRILARLRDDEIGKLCRSDPTILKLGSVLYRKIKRKKDKSVQVRRTVRAEMRSIANVYLLLLKHPEITQKCGDCMDMFYRYNFNQLRNVIDIYTTYADDSIKAGLKQNVCYLLKRAAKILRALLLSVGDDTRADDVAKFVELLEVWDDIIFGDAVYETNKRRETYLRKPEQLPNEDDMRMIRDHILKRMNILVSNKLEFFSATEFVELRDLALARLIIVNGRRDGEPSRLSISEWEMAKNDIWIDKQRLECLDVFDKMLMDSLKVTYITGKGNNHLVPLLIPEDTVECLDVLADKEYRQQADIVQDNLYLFANTRQSEEHTSGWHSLHRIMDKLPLKDPKKIKSSSNRHRISTLLASMDISPRDRDLFYKH